MKLGFIAFLFACFAVQTAHTQDLANASEAYTEAVSSGDRSARANAAIDLGNAALFNKADPAAIAMAFEAATALCVVRNCAGAEPFADWVSTQQSSNPYTHTDHLKLLAAYVDWRLDPNGSTKNRLDRALRPVRATQPTELSVLAFKRRYQADMRQRRWDATIESTDRAVEHFADYKTDVPGDYLTARMSHLVADYYDTKTGDSVLDFARLQAEWETLDREVGLAGVPGMERLYWLLEAWRYATQATTVARARDPEERQAWIDRRVDEILQRDLYPDYRRSTEPQRATARAPLPLCEGELDMTPPMGYPQSAAYRGLSGAVILHFVLKDGAVSDIEVLAAVPSRTFEEFVVGIVSQWTWKVTDGVVGETCGLDRSNIVLPLTFFIE